MANFPVRHAYPTPSVRPAARPARGLVARLLDGLFRAVDEAPFDLAWPPSARTATSGAGWRAPYAAPHPAPHAAPAPGLDYDPNYDLDRDPRPARRAA